MKHSIYFEPTWALLALLCLSLTACLPSPTLSTVQTPSTLYPLQVNITPALGKYREVLNQCAQVQPDMALFVKETPVSNLGEKEPDLQLRLGLPNQGVEYAFQVGKENLELVINANQKAQSITADQIRALFSGEITDWSQASGKKGTVHPWVYPDDNELGLIFDRVLMNGAQISPSASIAPDPESMQHAIAQDDNAIGFLPSSWLTSTVQAVGLEPSLASQLGYPVLALTETEPQGMMGVFIACLQKNGKSVVETP
jgi:hypothetical protein